MQFKCWILPIVLSVPVSAYGKSAVFKSYVHILLEERWHVLSLLFPFSWWTTGQPWTSTMADQAGSGRWESGFMVTSRHWNPAPECLMKGQPPHLFNLRHPVKLWPTENIPFLFFFPSLKNRVSLASRAIVMIAGLIKAIYVSAYSRKTYLSQNSTPFC